MSWNIQTYIGLARAIYIRYFWQGNHQKYGHIRCIYTVLANPRHIRCIYTVLANPRFVTWCKVWYQSSDQANHSLCSPTHFPYSLNHPLLTPYSSTHSPPHQPCFTLDLPPRLTLQLPTLHALSLSLSLSLSRSLSLSLYIYISIHPSLLTPPNYFFTLLLSLPSSHPPIRTPSLPSAHLTSSRLWAFCVKNSELSVKRLQGVKNSGCEKPMV